MLAYKCSTAPSTGPNYPDPDPLENLLRTLEGDEDHVDERRMPTSSSKISENEPERLRLKMKKTDENGLWQCQTANERGVHDCVSREKYSRKKRKYSEMVEEYKKKYTEVLKKYEKLQRHYDCLEYQSQWLVDKLKEGVFATLSAPEPTQKRYKSKAAQSSVHVAAKTPQKRAHPTNAADNPSRGLSPIDECTLQDPTATAPPQTGRASRLATDRVVCLKCGKRFLTVQGLSTHVRSSHSATRPYSCSQCKLRFTKPSHVRWHRLREHSAGR